MLLLALETSGATGGVAVMEDSRLLGSLSFTSTSLYSQRLLPSVEWLLDRTGKRIADVEAVGISIGPGSFTGLRVGLAAAKAIVFANKATLVSVNTLEALALRASQPVQGFNILPILDARQREVYAALFACKSGQLERLQEDYAGPIEHIADWITGPTVFAGDGLHRYEEDLRRLAGPNFVPASEIRSLPSPEEVAYLAMQRLRRGEKDDVLLLEPHYLRRSYTQRRKA